MRISDWSSDVCSSDLQVSGYHQMPYICPRWDTSSGEDYGRSPGMVALPDANTAQAIGETMLVAGQRAADPPILVPSDAFIDAPNTFPGGLGRYEADPIRDLGFHPFQVLDVGRNSTGRAAGRGRGCQYG